MTHPPDVKWITLSPFLAERHVRVGWRGEDGKPRTRDYQLTQQQAYWFATNAERMVHEKKAGFHLFSSGWTIYPREEIPDVASLWLS